jgi:hypothetical protein
MLLLQALDNLEDEVVLMVEGFHYMADFLLTLDVAVVIALGHQPVLGRLAVLRHHYHRCSICSLRGKKQIQKYQGIGVKWMCDQPDIANNSDNDDDCLNNNKPPTPHTCCHPIRHPLSHCQSFISNLIDIDNDRVVMVTFGEAKMDPKQVFEIVSIG